MGVGGWVYVLEPHAVGGFGSSANVSLADVTGIGVLWYICTLRWFFHGFYVVDSLAIDVAVERRFCGTDEARLPRGDVEREWNIREWGIPTRARVCSSCWPAATKPQSVGSAPVLSIL